MNGISNVQDAVSLDLASKRPQKEYLSKNVQKALAVATLAVLAVGVVYYCSRKSIPFVNPKAQPMSSSLDPVKPVKDHELGAVDPFSFSMEDPLVISNSSAKASSVFTQTMLVAASGLANAFTSSQNLTDSTPSLVKPIRVLEDAVHSELKNVDSSGVISPVFSAPVNMTSTQTISSGAVLQSSINGSISISQSADDRVQTGYNSFLPLDLPIIVPTSDVFNPPGGGTSTAFKRVDGERSEKSVIYQPIFLKDPQSNEVVDSPDSASSKKTLTQDQVNSFNNLINSWNKGSNHNSRQKNKAQHDTVYYSQKYSNSYIGFIPSSQRLSNKH